MRWRLLPLRRSGRHFSHPLGSFPFRAILGKQLLSRVDDERWFRVHPTVLPAPREATRSALKNWSRPILTRLPSAYEQGPVGIGAEPPRESVQNDADGPIASRWPLAVTR
jgi:hypothetical protein